MRRLLPALLLLALVAAACSDDESADPVQNAAATSTTDAPTTTTEPDEGGDEPPLFSSPVVTASPVSPLAASVTLTTEWAVHLRIVATADDHEVATPWTAEASRDHELPLVGMRADRTYDLSIEARTSDGEIEALRTEQFTTGPLPDGVPDLDISIDPDRAQPGLTILELNPFEAVVGGVSNPVVAVDAEGEVVWFYESGAFTGAVQQGPNGTVYAQNHPLGMREFTIDGRLVRVIGPDETGEEEVTEFDDGSLLVPYHADWVDLGTVHHDIYPMDDGTVLFLSSTVHEITAAQRAAIGCPDDDFEWNPFSDVIVHMDVDGTVLRTSDLWDVVDFDEVPGTWLCRRQGIDITDTERDWTHANALVYDAEREAIIVSVRHTDQLIALEFGQELGPQAGVRWILGAGATIPYEGESFHHTHGAMVDTDGSIVLYDNGNFRPGTVDGGGTAPSYSRAVRIEVDDASDDDAEWTARQVWDHVLDDPKTGLPAFAPFVSDADALPNGNVLVTHGGLGGFTDFQHVHVLEIVPDGTRDSDVVWELLLGTPDDQITMYRADRWDSLYFGPFWETP